MIVTFHNFHQKLSLHRQSPKTFQVQSFQTYSNKIETPDFNGTVSFDPVKMSQQKYNQNDYQTSDTPNWQSFDFIFLSGRVIEPNVNTAFPIFIRKLIIKT